MRAAEKHRTAENLPPLFQHFPPLFYNNKIRSQRQHSLKKSYQQDKEFIIWSLLINNLPIALGGLQFTILLIYLLFTIY